MEYFTTILKIEILYTEPSFIDVMSTPSLNKADKTGSSFFRTPGQALSLTSNFTLFYIVTTWLTNKSSEVCIKARSPPASVPFNGQVSEQTAVKWCIVWIFSVRQLDSEIAQAEYVMPVFSSKWSYKTLAAALCVFQNTQNSVVSRCCFAKNDKEICKDL